MTMNHDYRSNDLVEALKVSTERVRVLEEENKNLQWSLRCLREEKAQFLQVNWRTLFEKLGSWATVVSLTFFLGILGLSSVLVLQFFTRF